MSRAILEQCEIEKELLAEDVNSNGYCDATEAGTLSHVLGSAASASVGRWGKAAHILNTGGRTEDAIGTGSLTARRGGIPTPLNSALRPQS